MVEVMAIRFLNILKRITGFQLGRSKIRRFIPHSLFMKLKVIKYNFWLVTVKLSDDEGKGFAGVIKFLLSARKKILFYPDIPWETSVVNQICLQQGYRITNNINGKYDLAFKWKDTTFYQPDDKLKRIAETRQVINIGFNDIRKKHVDAVFKEVFGYFTRVDPLTFTGKCVRKSDKNAVHDGQIIECPIADPDPESIYQKLIDNQIDAVSTMIMRVPIYKGAIPMMYILTKPVEARFSEYNSSRRLVSEISEFLTQEEQRNILLFSERMGIDYGELDVLRDRSDGKIYILDANNTPDGDEIQLKEARKEIKFEAKVFRDTFLA